MAVLDKIEVGKRVEELEKLLNMNTRQFALSLNKAADPSYLGKVEKGEKSLSAKYVEWICKAHKVDRNWLLLGTGVPFINGTNVPHEKTTLAKIEGANSITENAILNILNTLAASNRDLADSAKKQSEANYEQSQANKILSQSNADLVAMVQNSKTTVHDPEQIDEALETRLSDILLVVAQVGVGTKWKSLKEAVEEINRFVDGTSIGQIKVGSPAGARTGHK